MARKYYITVGVLALVFIILYSLLPIYSKDSPTLLGLPLFYWYQMILMPIGAIVFFIVILTIKD
ncbi:hypothetical protein BFU36_00665 [Sulfolobus sp. A20]|uniref:DUF3311 domain-containing protein n=1 Tax=Sulfolobaceae TaxID=118883 RepID=UPI000845F338|nr:MULTISPECIES: DUF3311 domain-containing protein [unclassified Sulfolobus]TRM75690.1 DUF3311 domain-containing protein [Sulfolobus sp. A20-N-F8]TRM78209.1 DUF3311 domain-containing protein [Sulfolobus sp. B5]TRM81895.1 DUF3311 domain-containing protein [Sulfolobus sp. D5]TRM84032.1 DUF3311 domain-containing protein [Sulfolobus sp. A20-N-F6]TRM86879.1 DUF3311 domain-containing protein [Sulfolobus sp. C3]TRN03463.1 DUF3311 domain-containing protein [Sulfolobus sp. F1]TRN03630.1 DUF3311 domai